MSARVAESAAAVAESVTRQLASHTVAWERAQASLREALKPVIEVGNMVADWDAAFLRLEPRAYELGQLGWTVPMWAELHMLRSVFVDATPQEVDDAFEHYYVANSDENARVLFEEIRSATQISNWQPLLEEAIAAYEQRRYLIVVPSLLLVLEGIIAVKASIATTRINLKKGIQTRRADAVSGFDRLLWASVEGFVLELYRDSDFGAHPPARLNRHWILHGRQAPSWSRVDCLRLFQAVHTLKS